MVIGSGPSGTDISRDIAGVAKEVHLASRWAFAATSEKLPGHANMWLHSEVISPYHSNSKSRKSNVMMQTLHCPDDNPTEILLGRSTVLRKTGVWSSTTAVGSKRMSSCIALGTYALSPRAFFLLLFLPPSPRAWLADAHHCVMLVHAAFC